MWKWLQKCISVGCVPTAAVAATRYQSWDGGLGRPHLEADSLPQGRPPIGRRPPFRDRTSFRGRSPRTDKRFWKHYLPLRWVKIKIYLYSVPNKSKGHTVSTKRLINDDLGRVLLRWQNVYTCLDVVGKVIIGFQLTDELLQIFTHHFI